VQKLYSTNKGTNVIPALLNGKAITGQDSLYVSAVIDKNSNDLIIKVVNASGKEQTNNFKVYGVKKIASKGLLTTLQSDNPGSENSFAHPQNVAPKKTSIAIKGNKINLTIFPNSCSVISVQMKKWYQTGRNTRLLYIFIKI
jgi:alpha-L-arabinofuranosidase